MKVATYGFAADQCRKLGRILRLSKTNPYELVEFSAESLPDLLLVFGEDQLNTSDIEALPQQFHARIILVGKRRVQTDSYPFIGYPLVSSRVLSALDQILCANEEFSGADESIVEGVDEPLEEETLEQDSQAEAESVTVEDSLDVSIVAVDDEVSESEGSIESEEEEALDTLEVSEDEEPKVTGNHDSENDDELPEVTTAISSKISSGAYRVLVVDDSHPMQQALAKELETAFENLEIDFADEGLIALDLAEQNHYDFIFLDIMMPGIDGFETCTRMREMEKLKKLPIIMLSSKTSPLDEVKGIMAGSSTYLTKPIEPTEFQKVITRIRKWLDNFS